MFKVFIYIQDTIKRQQEGSKRKGKFKTVLLFLVAFRSATVFAACSNLIHFEIPAQPVDSALLKFAQIAKLPILFPSEAFSNINSNNLVGDFCVDEALVILLEGTGVDSYVGQSGQLVLHPPENEDDTVAGLNAAEIEDDSGLFSKIKSIFTSAARNQNEQGRTIREVTIEEITVTGSRIRGVNGMASPVPVTTITKQELSSFEPNSTIAEQLDALPQFFGTLTAQRGSFPISHEAGAGYLNLRNLGRQRTLVLLDGSRVVPADKRGPVNVETFPTALISSVDIVTGGASAAYGADAIGGVVNFVLNREFKGLKVNTGAGITEEGDGERSSFSLAAGWEIFDDANLIASFESRKIAQIDRKPEELSKDWYQRWGWVTNPAWYPGAPAGIPQRLAQPWVTRFDSPYGLIRGTGVPELDDMKFLPDGSDITPFIMGDIVSDNGIGSTNTMSGGPESVIAHTAFNSPVNGREVVGRSGFMGLNILLNENISVFSQLMVGRSESSKKNPRGLANFPDPYFATIAVDNAFLPESIRQVMLENNLDEFKLYKSGAFLGIPELGYQEHEKGVFTTSSWSIGMDSILPNGWEFNASWQKGRSNKVAGEYPMMRIDRIFLGLDAVRDPDSGAIVCRVQLYNPTLEQLAGTPALQGRISSRSPGGNVSEFANLDSGAIPLKSPIGLDNTVRDCVPYNVLGSGNISREALDYSATPKIVHSTVNQDFAEILLNGDLFGNRPYGPINFAAGLTWRDQDLFVNIVPEEIDELGPVLNAPELGIRGIPPGFTGGSPYLWMFSTAPLISGQYDVWELFSEINFQLWESQSNNQSVNVSLAYRNSHYSNSGSIGSWKTGFDFQASEELRFRITQSRDVREPTFSERYDAQGGGTIVRDPFLNNESYTITTVYGGNPKLEPEIADTTVVGLVYIPVWLKNMQMSLDWYDVDLNKKIDLIDIQSVLDGCAGGIEEFCKQVSREKDGTIGRILNIYKNIAKANSSGVDLEIKFNREVNLFNDYYENLDIRMLVGYLLERSDTPLGAQKRDIVGELETPEIVGILTARYTLGPISLQLQGRYIDSVLSYIDWVEGVDVDDNKIASSTWWNGEVRYSSTINSGHELDISFNIQNMFNKNPPVIPWNATRAGDSGGSQMLSDSYDIYGRRYSLNFGYAF